MREFKDIAGFIRHLATLEPAVISAGHRGVRDGAEIIRDEAKAELGFAPPDNPLLRTGELAESIEVTADRDEAEIGSNEDIAVYQEMGTPDARFPIPARSFLGGAAVRKGDEVADLIGTHVVRALAGLPPSNSKKPERIG
jgi:phage gpG-like protein